MRFTVYRVSGSFGLVLDLWRTLRFDGGYLNIVRRNAHRAPLHKVLHFAAYPSRTIVLVEHWLLSGSWQPQPPPKLEPCSPHEPVLNLEFGLPKSLIS